MNPNDTPDVQVAVLPLGIEEVQSIVAEKDAELFNLKVQAKQYEKTMVAQSRENAALREAVANAESGLAALEVAVAQGKSSGDKTGAPPDTAEPAEAPQEDAPAVENVTPFPVSDPIHSGEDDS